MSIDPDKLPPVVNEVIEKVDIALSLLGENPLNWDAPMAQLGRGEVGSKFGDGECAGHGHQLRTQSDISAQIGRMSRSAKEKPP